MHAEVRKYLKSIRSTFNLKKATEHTYRPSLLELVESLGSKVQTFNDPKRVECGAPDIDVSQTPGDLTIGYIETKDLNVSLDAAEQTEQIERYLNSIENLILTNYLEFRWYVDGQLRNNVQLASIGRDKKLMPNEGGDEKTANLLNDFLSHTPLPITSPPELAQRMARLTHIIRDIIIEAFEIDKASSLLVDLRMALAKELLPGIDRPENTSLFADMYSQTIAYGLFAARCNHKGGVPFQRLGSASKIPKTNPFLRKLLELISGPDLNDEQYVGFVDDLTQLLTHADMDSILSDFGKRKVQEDPVVHFYETYLAAYDPELREKRGVYTTPEEVVSYIVRSADHILREHFNLPDGLADSSTVQYHKEEDGDKPKKVKDKAHRVLILDPACGTATFLYSIVDLIRNQFMKKGNAGMWSGYVRDHLLPRIFGFELLMAPYTVAHLKLGLQLSGQDLPSNEQKIWKYDFLGDERLGIYLTNSLEQADKQTEPLLGPLRAISEEANAAARVKRELPIMVVLGNPPYSRASYNRGEWIEKLMEDYKVTIREEESQIQAISNDYIKFIRFAQWKIDKTKRGILTFITGHGYIDGPLPRDMRKSLLESFDTIFILNLHGSTRREAARKTSERDEPVFAIQQGTAITIGIKGSQLEPGVYYSERFGSLKGKLEYLMANDVSSTDWTKVTPKPPNYFFTPLKTTTNKESEYKGNPNIPELFGTGDRKQDKEKFWASGFSSQQDDLAISFNDEEVEEKISDLISSRSEEKLREKYRLCTTDQWDYKRAKDALKDDSWKNNISDCAFRPFDIRRTVFDRNVVTILRATVMDQLLNKDNLCLVISRVVNDAHFAHVFVSRHPVDKIFLSTKTSTNAFIFPLYRYYEPDNKRKRGQTTFTQPTSNFDQGFIAKLEKRLGMKFVIEGEGDLNKTFGTEQAFHYLYTVLHSRTYRKRYSHSLKEDFPRIPFTSDKQLFSKLSVLGKELVSIHLLESEVVNKFITRYPVSGDNIVQRGYPKHIPQAAGKGETSNRERVYINEEQYFEGIPSGIWEFHVGGHQVCERWLKERRKRSLDYEELNQFQKIVVAIKETNRLMDEIEETIPSWPLQ